MRTVAAQAQPPEGGGGGTQAINYVTDVYHVASDHLGSTRVMVGEDGELVEAYSYGAWGEVAASVQLGRGVGYTFTGQEEDAESGLMNYRARLYDPALGRFLGVDPAGQFASPYLYGANSPTMMVDPDGELAILTSIAIGAAIGAAVGTVRAAHSGDHWLEGAGKGALVGAVGGALGYFGGGTFVNNLAWGIGEGAVTGGLDAALWGNNVLEGAGWGAASGAAFAGLSSGYEAVKNSKAGYGFLTNEGVTRDLIANKQYQDAIDFVQMRYGMEGVTMTYNRRMSDFGKTNRITGDIDIGSTAFQSSSVLKATMVHEYAHSTVDRVLTPSGWTWSSPTAPSNYHDGVLGYANEITNAGRLHVNYSALGGSFPSGAPINPLWNRFGSSKWWHFLPRRFSNEVTMFRSLTL